MARTLALVSVTALLAVHTACWQEYDGDDAPAPGPVDSADSDVDSDPAVDTATSLLGPGAVRFALTGDALFPPVPGRPSGAVELRVDGTTGALEAAATVPDSLEVTAVTLRQGYWGGPEEAVQVSFEPTDDGGWVAPEGAQLGDVALDAWFEGRLFVRAEGADGTPLLRAQIGDGDDVFVASELLPELVPRVPPVNSQGRGWGYLTYDPGRSVVTVVANTERVETTEVRLSTGQIDVFDRDDPALILGFQPDPSVATWAAVRNPVDDEFYYALRRGSLYYTVYTRDHPRTPSPGTPGELRGKVEPPVLP